MNKTVKGKKIVVHNRCLVVMSKSTFFPIYFQWDSTVIVYKIYNRPTNFLSLFLALTSNIDDFVCNHCRAKILSIMFMD